MDGPDSNIFHYFRSLILRGLMEVRKHVDSFKKIIDIMARGNYFNIHIVNFSARQGNATSLSGIQIVNPMKHASVLWVQPTTFRSFYYQTSLVFTCL